MKRLPAAILGAIGSEIRRRRVDAGYSLEQLGLHAELHKSYLGRVELGQVDLSISALWSIASALRCDVADLLPSGEEGLPPDVIAAARALSRVRPDIRGAILLMLGDTPGSHRHGNSSRGG